MVEPDEIFERIEQILQAATGGALTGKRVLVSAGGTREPLDSVRYVGNRSSGRMGVALAEEARRRGADVTLLAANLSVPAPPRVNVVDTPTAADLEREALARGDADVIVMAAAVADYRPSTPSEGKRAKDGSDVDGRARADDRRPRGDRSRPQVRAGARRICGGRRRARSRASAREAAREERRHLRVQRCQPLRHRLRRARQRGRRRISRGRASDREGAQARRCVGCARRSGAATLVSMTDAVRAGEPVASRSAADVVAAGPS